MNLEKILQQWKEGEVNSTIMIEVTEDCNFACAHCLRGPANKAVFSQETLKKFLEKLEEKEISYIDSITFTGGEPLLHPEVITDTIKTLWRYSIDLGNFYIATNGSAFNKESLLAISELHGYCCDNDISCVEISNSKWHQEERRRLGLSNIIPDDFDLFYDLYYDVVEDIMENHYPSFNEITFLKDHRRYVSMIKEGKFKGEGVSPSADQDGMIYLNSRGKMIFNSCDLSFKSQAKLGIDL